MGFSELLAGFGVFAIFSITPILYKPCASLFPAKMSSVFTSIWMAIGLLLSFPFFYNLLFIEGKFFIYSVPIWIIVLSAAKGIILFNLFTATQVVRKESLSSATFYDSMALGGGALINYFFFDENLKTIQFIAILGIGILGTAFFLFGHAASLSKKAKICFFIALSAMILCIVSDHIVIKASNWYVHIFTYTITMFAFGISQLKSRKEAKDILLNKYAIAAGAGRVIAEYYLISIMVTVIPVSIAIFFMQLTIPTIMLISALKWKEGKWHEQLAFGIISFLISIPIIFG